MKYVKDIFKIFKRQKKQEETVKNSISSTDNEMIMTLCSLEHLSDCLDAIYYNSPEQGSLLFNQLDLLMTYVGVKFKNMEYSCIKGENGDPYIEIGIKFDTFEDIDLPIRFEIKQYEENFIIVKVTIAPTKEVGVNYNLGNGLKLMEFLIIKILEIGKSVEEYW